MRVEQEVINACRVGINAVPLFVESCHYQKVTVQINPAMTAITQKAGKGHGSDLCMDLDKMAVAPLPLRHGMSRWGANAQSSVQVATHGQTLGAKARCRA